MGDNLPSDQEVVDLYKSNGIGRMRMYAPNPQTLQALRGSNIELLLGVPNEDLPHLANSTVAASKWVRDNVLNYYPDVKFRIIVVGNEIDLNSNSTDASLAPLVLHAMSNVYDALASASLKDEIKVSTAINPGLLRTSSPPSQGLFEGAWNLFDVMLDAIYSAVENAGGPNVEIVVSETGWPSAGDTAASVENAATYYRNVINHVKGGSPKRPGRAIETYLFAMFDENLKVGPQNERHFGLFSPNKQPKYQNTWATPPLVESLVLYCTI
ncbi:hypothetical protein RHGRI_002049 [Rhododendron griersonianum]|uniref:Glucan endo-1,3-beta-D-glucosidase n=1 Tax=Rhododendron griersonianum TaxID=479676 RepID=A0AAV6LNM7_9ERIC|nr:hypothetical protein RHGRI_002049 [Rhododendron griersonianum]